MNDDYLMIESQISSSQNLLQEYVLKILQASCQNFNFVLEVVERNSFEYKLNSHTKIELTLAHTHWSGESG